MIVSNKFRINARVTPCFMKIFVTTSENHVTQYDHVRT